MQSSLKLYYADHFVLPLPEGHRFPMEKYSRLRARLHDSGLFADDDFRVPHAATDTETLRAPAAGHAAPCIRAPMPVQLVLPEQAGASPGRFLGQGRRT